MSLKQTFDDCVLRDKKNLRRCTALTDVHRDCGPKCPFYKNRIMEQESRRKAEERLKNTKVYFQDLLPDGWDK